MNAVLVEYYADWCGPLPRVCAFLSRIRVASRRLERKCCRRLDQLRRQFQRRHLSQKWRCLFSDAKSRRLRRAQAGRRAAYHPAFFFKYFPRLSTTYSDGQQVETAHSAQNLRDQLASKVSNEYAALRYADWPNLRYLDVMP